MRTEREGPPAVPTGRRFRSAAQRAGGQVERTASGHLKVIGPAGSAGVALRAVVGPPSWLQEGHCARMRRVGLVKQHRLLQAMPAGRRRYEKKGKGGHERTEDPGARRTGRHSRLSNHRASCWRFGARLVGGFRSLDVATAPRPSAPGNSRGVAMSRKKLRKALKDPNTVH